MTKVNSGGFAALTIISLFLSNLTSAQSVTSDTAIVDSTYFYEFQAFQLLDDSLPPMFRSEFDNVHRNIFENSRIPYMIASNAGQAIYSPLLEPSSSTDISQGVYSAFEPYLTKGNNIKYFRNNPPYTSIYYLSGAKKEEMIDLEHSRNFGRNLNASIYLNKGSSDGFFNHVENRWSHFNLTTNFTSNDHRYAALAHYYYNYKEVNENGGFNNFDLVTNPETVGSSRLSNAQNTLREEGVYFSQSLGIGSKFQDETGVIKSPLRIGYDINYVGGYRYFRDDGDFNPQSGLEGLNTDVYSTIFYDSSITTDSIVHVTFSNQLNLFVLPGNQNIKLFARHELVGYDQRRYVDTLYENLMVGAVNDISLSSYRLIASAEFGIGGYRAGDVELGAKLCRSFPDSSGRNLSLEFQYQLFEPLFSHQQYQSNNFYWSNEFVKEGRLNAQLAYTFLGYRLTAGAGTISDLIYYGLDALPNQSSRDISFISAGLQKKLSWKRFHLDNNITYQAIANRDILPLPQFIARECLYYQSAVFDGVLKFQLGADLFIYSYHYGYDYMPALNRFHIQDRSRLGGYPFVDLFLNLQLKRAFFFLKMEHFNKGLAGNDFFRIPDYPYPPRAFKFGLRWTLLD
ncbi:MAG: putative porin [Vicingaceae bacterium]